MIQHTEPDYRELCEQIHAILQDNACSLTEYELLKQLRTGHPWFDTPADNLKLFQQHFVIFHCLYRLQQELWDSGQGDLAISPLEIAIRPWPKVRSDTLAPPDTLRTYYLDLQQLRNTCLQDVEGMISEFWDHMSRRDNRAEALKIIGLQDPVDEQTIRKRYRQLVMTHHPDRGGDKLTLQLINAAMADLFPKNTP